MLLAAIFIQKASEWVVGRKGLLEKLGKTLNRKEKHIWFHFASLGEFEQGRPVLEKIKAQYPKRKIVVTFFSPSGYEIRKNYALADLVMYLPLDTPKNARQFVNLINPEFAVFTKYDYWLNYFMELKRRAIPLYVISAIFRPNYSSFKWHGVINRRMLRLVSKFFVQDKNSKELLETIDIQDVVVSGDTRFDRVAENASNPKSISIVEQFAKDAKVLIAGSTWLEDEKLIADLPIKYPEWKFIIAPHEVNEGRIADVKKLFGESSELFSKVSSSNISNLAPQILIIDNIGMLSSLYQYADVAYIGGGFGVGIHNTLEAAAFGRPVIFGPNFSKFNEAVDLIALGAGFSISNSAELNDTFSALIVPAKRAESGKKAGDYVKSRTGATAIILSHILPKIS